MFQWEEMDVPRWSDVQSSAGTLSSSGSSVRLPIFIRRHSPQLLFSGASSFPDFLGPVHVSEKNPLIKLCPTGHFTYFLLIPTDAITDQVCLSWVELQQRVTSSTRPQRPSWSKGPPSQAFCPFMSAVDPQLPRKDPDLLSGTSCTCLRDTHTHTSIPTKGKEMASRQGHFCCSVSQSRTTPCNTMHRSMPGFPILCHLPEFAQTRQDH